MKRLPVPFVERSARLARMTDIHRLMDITMKWEQRDGNKRREKRKEFGANFLWLCQKFPMVVFGSLGSPVGDSGASLEQDRILKKGACGVADVRQFSLYPYRVVGFWPVFPLSLGFQRALFRGSVA